MNHPALGLTREERKDQIRRIRTLRTGGRARIASTEVLCARAQVILSEDPHNSVRYHLARNKDLLPSIIEELCTDTNLYVQRFTAENQPLTLDQQERFLAHPSPWVQLELAENRHQLDRGVAERLARHTRKDVAQRAVFRSELSGDFRRRLASEGHAWVNDGLARSPHTPQDVLEYLAQSSEHSVVTGVATNRNAPLELVSELVAKVITFPWGGHEVVFRNPNLTEEHLEVLAAGDRTTLHAVLQHKDVPFHLTRKHLAGDNRYLAQAAARGASDEDLQAIARLSNLADRADAWSKDHPQRDEILSLADSWSGTYNELLEALELTRR